MPHYLRCGIFRKLYPSNANSQNRLLQRGNRWWQKKKQRMTASQEDGAQSRLLQVGRQPLVPVQVPVLLPQVPTPLAVFLCRAKLTLVKVAAEVVQVQAFPLKCLRYQRAKSQLQMLQPLPLRLSQQ
jgi:hypothetical protein